MKKRIKKFLWDLVGRMVIGVLIWVFGLVSSVGLAYLFTDIRDYENLAKKAGTVVMQELRTNKKEIVETVHVLAKEYQVQKPEAIKRFLFTHKDIVVRIINESFPEHEQDIREILTDVSPEAQKQTRKILNEIEITVKQ